MRPSTRPDCRPVCRREPCRLAVETGALATRGLAELRPRRLSYPQLAATAVRQMAFRSPGSIAGASVHMPLGGADPDTTLRLLADVPEVRLAPAVFPTFLDELHAAATPGGGRHVLAVLGDAEAPRGDVHAALARSLVGFNPQIEQRLAQELLARTREEEGLGPIGVERGPFVVEERPGKAVALSLEEPSLRLNTKRWQALAARPAGETTRPPLDTPDGWGVGALIAAPGGGTTALGSRTLQLASLDGELPGATLTLDSGRDIRDAAAAWLESAAGLGIGALRRVVLSVPWLAVAATIGEAFASPAGSGRGPRLAYPDLVYGWQPFLSLVEFLYGDELPALFVHTGRFPALHLVAVW